MADSKKTILFDVEVTASNAIQQMQRLTESIDALKVEQMQLQAQMKSAKYGTDEYKRLEKQLIANKEAQKAYRKEMNELSRGVQNTIISQSSKYKDTLKGLAAQLSVEKDKLRQIEIEEGKLSDAYIRQQKVVKDLNDQVMNLERNYGTHSRNVGNYESALDGLQGKISKLRLALAAVIAVVAAGVKVIKGFFDTIREQTQVAGDWFTFELQGMKTAYQELINMMVSGEGWGQLVANLKTAYENGKKFASMLDEIFERNNSLKILEAEYNEEIEKNRVAARNTALSNEERLQAAENVIKKEAELAGIRRDIAQQELDANKGILQQKTKMTDADVEYFINRYNQNRESIKEAQEFARYERDMNARIASESQVRNYEKRQQLEQELEARRALLSEEARGVVEMVRKYALSNDELVANYVESYANLQRVNGDFERANARTFLQRDRMLAEIAGEEQKNIAATAKMQEDSLKQQEKNMQDYVNTVSALLLEIANPDKTQSQIIKIKEHYRDLTNDLKTQIQQGNISFEEATYYRVMLAQRMAQDIKAVEDAAADERTKQEQQRIAEETQKRQERLKRDLQLAWDNENEQYRIRKEFLLKELEAENLAAEERAALEQQLTELFKTEQAKRIASVMEYVGQFETLMQSVSQIYDNQSESRTQRYEQQNADEKAALEKRLKAGLISQRQYDDRVARMDKELADKKAEETRKQAEREKALAVFQIAINTAQAIMKIWAEVPKMDFGVSTAALTAVAVALGAVQSAAVMSQPLPKARRGGLIQGASHEQGGVLLEAEGGERIVAAEPSRAFPELLNLISYIGKHSATPETGYALRNATSATGTDYDRIEQAMTNAVSQLQVWLSLQELRDAQQTQVQIEQLAKQ
jgi:hypothetical protein